MYRLKMLTIFRKIILIYQFRVITTLDISLIIMTFKLYKNSIFGLVINFFDNFGLFYKSQMYGIKTVHKTKI